MPIPVFLGLRFLVLVFFFFTSLYCLLTYTPFTYTHVIQAGMFPQLVTFTRIHRWLYVLFACLAVATLLGDFRDKKAKRFAVAFAVFMGLSALGFIVHPIMPTLANNNRSFVWSQLFLLPAILLAVVDHVVSRKAIVWAPASTREESSVFHATLACLLLAFTTYATIFLIRAAPGLGLGRRDLAVGLVLSFLLHATFVGAIYCTWCLIRAIATWGTFRAALVEHGLLATVHAALFTMLARNIVFTSISLKGVLATMAAITWALMIVSNVSAMAFRRATITKEPVRSGVRLFFAPLSIPRAHWVARILWGLGLLFLAVRLQIAASALDVNGLNQKLCACFVWTLLFGATLAIFRTTTVAGGRTLLFVALASAGTLTYRLWRAYGQPGDSVPTLEKLAAAEPSFGFLYDLASSGQGGSMAELFEFMQKNSSIPHEKELKPLDIQFVGDMNAVKTPKPNIFVIVIDSLRRDYLSPFNPAVTFTPSLEKFAKSSDVFVNTFTHYGATGLSEPSIWVGGMMPHKQYITPFMPMNSLEKLLKGNNYTRMVSVDSILQQLIDQTGNFTPLDAGKATGEFDLCNSLDELRLKIEAKKNQEIRFFAYTQAQNIHVSTIAREGTTVIGNAHFPGFYDPYASRLQRVDLCFGRFIDYLEAQGLYDNSIVVFTADHGDLLGEEGKWGHAYNLNPEVVRIPLIIHRPERLRGLAVEKNKVAFSTDIAPSLYRLLGYMPATLGGHFGQSLYGPRAADREWHMLVSSYGPVYGILEDEGKHLYVADAVGYTDTYYDVAAGSNAPRDSVPEEARTRNAQRIIQGVTELHEAFHVENLSGATGGAAPKPTHGSP